MQDINQSAKGELIARIRELEELLEAIKSEKNQQETLNFPWVGNLGNWY